MKNRLPFVLIRRLCRSVFEFPGHFGSGVSLRLLTSGQRAIGIIGRFITIKTIYSCLTDLFSALSKFNILYMRYTRNCIQRSNSNYLFQ